MITKKELLMGRDTLFPNEYTEEVSRNLDKLLIPLNAVRQKYGKPMHVSSGWRPSKINASLSNSAKKSNHMLGLAADFKDPNGELSKWIIENLEFVAQQGLYVEDFRWTKGWVHLQCVAPGSRKRIFVPSSAPMTNPDSWDGIYDSKLNY